MTSLADIDTIRLGTDTPIAVWIGDTKIWPLVSTPDLGTIIYDEQFDTDYASLPSNSPVAATVGQSLFFNVRSGDSIASNRLSFASPTTSLIFCDAAAKLSPRARLKGRLHYTKAVTTSSVATANGWLACGLTGTGADNGWHVAEHSPGVLYHGSGRIRDNRSHITNNNPGGDVDNRGNYQSGQWFGAQVYTVETALLERGTAGTMAFSRLDGGDWHVVWLESMSNTTGALSAQVLSTSGVDYYSRLLTANSAFEPTPLVQHSFNSGISPSDGAGQPETGGGGIAAETSGSVTIASNKLAMSADGSGQVVYDCGDTGYVGHCKQTIYDGSVCGPIIRWQDSSNYLYAELDATADTLELIEVVAGSATTLETIALNPGSTDTWDVTDGLDIYWTWRSAMRTTGGDRLIVTVAPGVAHDSYIESSTTRFASSTKCGVMISKGAGVSSSTAEDLVVFAGTQVLPDFD